MAATEKGFWFNKRGLLSLESPIKHDILPTAEGYVIKFLVAGKITFVHADKGRQTIDVKTGDTLRSSNEEFYLLLGA
jgi:hypothetical protein